MYTVKGKIDEQSFVTEYLPLVRRQALILQVKLPSSVELDDLIQAGVVGLLDALGRFDASNGTSFMTFASQRIRGAMIDELRTFDWLPRSARRNARTMELCIQKLEQELGRAPEENEIAGAMGMSMPAYRQLLTDTNNGYLLPLEELVAEGTEPTAGPAGANLPFEEFFNRECRERLVAAIEELPEREKLLLVLYYQEELGLKEIGAVLGVSESRVCQLHSQAVSRLRARLRDQD